MWTRKADRARRCAALLLSLCLFWPAPVFPAALLPAALLPGALLPGASGGLLPTGLTGAGWVSADNDDDDDDDRPAGTVQPAPSQPERESPQTGTAPDLTLIARELRIGTVWAEVSPTRLVAVHASLERAGLSVGSLTLSPTSFEPVPLSQSGLVSARSTPTTAQLQGVLSRLRSQTASRLTAGQYAAASLGGPQLPLYWRGRLVAYLTLDARGLPRYDSSTEQARSRGTVRVR